MQNGHFQWTCLPFGLKSSPAIFQRILSNIIRRHHLQDFYLNYIDDILVFSQTFEEHIIQFEKLLQAIKTERFKLKLLKCKFAHASIKYLGHIIENNKIKSHNLQAIQNFPTPKNRKNVQFLEKINFYHQYMEDATRKLEPLYNLLRKSV